MSDANPLESQVEFAENPEPRCACVLLLDTSGSMAGAKIDALNEGLKVFHDTLVKDTLASRRVEVAVITFNSQVTVVQDFITVDQLQPPTLATSGMTHMGAGVNKALDLIQARKKQYKDNGVDYYRPWVFMITDGAPQGEDSFIMELATRRIREDEENKRIAFFAVGVEGADMERLGSLVVRKPARLTGLNFREMFVWLSASMQGVANSQVGDQVALPQAGWGQV